MTQPSLRPLFPVPRLVERPWGGTALRAWGRACADGSRIGESWELGQVADCDSPLEGSEFPTLSAAVSWDGGNWLGVESEGFPLLIKLIDARETLSIQVHPSQDGPGHRAKNECWAVLGAPPGAFLYAGTEVDLSPDELVERVGAGDLSPLRKLPVQVGDVVMVPAGAIHAITAGLVLAEVQQSSDTTYRLYDWGRAGLDGKPRELHLEAARACVDPHPNPGLKPLPAPVDSGRELLCATPWFALARLRPGNGERMETRDRFKILMVLEGPVDLVWQGGRKVLEKGRTVLVPRGLRFEVAGGLLLEIWVPDWDRDILGPVLAAGHSRQAAYQLSAGLVKATGSFPDLSPELLDVVDPSGNVIGQATRERVHREGLLHRAVHALVWHPDGRILLQKRSASKACCPGLWDTSVGGHVGSGEDVLDAVLRECREELGIRVDARDLDPLGRYLFDRDTADPELVDSWGMVHAGPFLPDPVEVEDVAWFSREDVERLLETGEATPHFALQWELALRPRTSCRP